MVALRTAGAVAIALGLLAGCSSGGADPTPAAPDSASSSAASGSAASGGSSPSSAAPAGVRVLAEHLQVPWGVAFLPDRSALVGERTNGQLVQITAAGVVSTVGTVPGVVPDGEGGLLGLAVSPDFAGDHRVYAYLSAKSDNRVVRFSFTNGRIGPTTPILTGIATAGNHNGGRIAFGPDGLLYVTTGDAREPSRAQNRSSLNGKVLRITPNGRPAPGNPFPNSPVYTYGHRNVEGIAWAPGGRLYATEFGQDLEDEVNLLRPGHDYGWPIVEGKDPKHRFTPPLVTWPTSQASPSGVAYADGALWVGALRGERLYRIPVRADGSLGQPTSYLTGRYGRIRTVVAAPDGSLWLTTSNQDGRGSPAATDDRVLRFVP